MGIRFPLLSDSHPRGAVARAYGACPEAKGPGSRALFVIDELGTIRWSRAYPVFVNPGVDGILCALEPMAERQDAGNRRADEEGRA